jgi:OOP family OmpA-OmpF porin
MAHNPSLPWHMVKHIVGWALTLLALSIGVAPQAFAQPADTKGSRDHPLISRYAGSYIIGFDTRDFDELTLPLGPTVPVEGRFAFQPSKSQRVEGRVTRILYVAPQGRSSLEVLRNYQQALNKAGFQTLFACTQEECDSIGNVNRFVGVVYPQDRTLKNRSPMSEYAFSGPKDLRYLAAKLAAPEREVYVSLMVAVETRDQFKETANHPLVLLEVVETKAMDTDKVTINAETMAKDLASTGRVALYGIYFETGKAEIKAESEPTLAEIGKLLTQDRALKLYVVGHTDNVGGYDYNMDLSNRRAQAVAAHLRTRYGIEVPRLRAVGVGLLAPVASNDSEDGKAKNRRVELVKQ